MKDQGLAGTMIWSVDMDDFSSICGEKYPLMRYFLCVKLNTRKNLFLHLLSIKHYNTILIKVMMV